MKTIEIEANESFTLIIKQDSKVIFEGVLSEPTLKIKRGWANPKVIFQASVKISSLRDIKCNEKIDLSSL